MSNATSTAFWDVQMSLPLKQNRDEDERRLPDVRTRKSVESEKAGLRKNGTAEVAKFSRLSAQMVELSLQRAQRDPALHEASPAKLKEVSSSSPLGDALPVKPKAVSEPLPWPSASTAPLQAPEPEAAPLESKIPQYWPNYWKDVRRNVRRNAENWLAGARVSGLAAVRILSEHAKSAQKKFAGLNFGSNNIGSNNIKTPDGIAPRLWTPTGVAALSAVLVVGVISGVRHYAHIPYTPQDRGRNTSPTIPAVQNMMQNISQPRPVSTGKSPRVKNSRVNSSTVNTNGTAAMQHPAKSSAAKHASVEHAPAQAAIRKVRRKHPDDDYVAKDTFVSYDAKGKPIR